MATFNGEATERRKVTVAIHAELSSKRTEDSTNSHLPGFLQEEIMSYDTR